MSTRTETTPDAATAGSFSTETTIDGLTELVGTTLGISDFVDITQERINTFADATDDHQWIHTDPVRAAKGPFGGTIAHGYLTLSMIAGLSGGVFTVTDASAVVNYGLDKARFPAAVPSGARIRLEAGLAEVTPVPGGVQARLSSAVVLEGSPKPAVVADVVLRFYR